MDVRGCLAQPRHDGRAVGSSALRGVGARTRVLREPTDPGAALLADSRGFGERGDRARRRRDPDVAARDGVHRRMAPCARTAPADGMGRSAARGMRLAAEPIRALPEPLRVRAAARVLGMDRLRARPAASAAGSLRAGVRLDRGLEPVLPRLRRSLPARPRGSREAPVGPGARTCSASALSRPLRTSRALDGWLRRLALLRRRPAQPLWLGLPPTAASPFL